MRRVLRQDPDVILIGEMRDEETVRTALSAAETGHLVLSTLHTLDATETINRIIDFFPPHLQQQARVMLASTLRGAVSQRLVPTVDGTGRVAASEIMVVTGRVQDLILSPTETGKISQVIAEGEYYGMQTFDQSLLGHVAGGRRLGGDGDGLRVEPARLQADARLLRPARERHLPGLPRDDAEPAAEPSDELGSLADSDAIPLLADPPIPTSLPEALLSSVGRRGHPSPADALRWRPRRHRLPRLRLRRDHLGQVDAPGDPRPRRRQPPLLRARALARRESARGRSRCACERSRSAGWSSGTPIPRSRRGSSTR